MKTNYTKWFALIGVVLFLGVAVAPCISAYTDTIGAKPLRDGNIWYVGGTGPQNFSKIQQAIDIATFGDTIFVYNDSSPYDEWIRLKAGIDLIGEDKNTTILTTTKSGTNVDCKNYVTVSGFTLMKSGSGSTGIYIFDEYVNITNNIIIGYPTGIDIGHSDYCTIEGNEIRDGIYGIDTYEMKHCTISNNVIKDNQYAIDLNSPEYTNVTNNRLLNNGLRYLYYYSDSNNVISGNTVNDKPLLYLLDEQDLAFDNVPIGQLILHRCKNILINNIDLFNASFGITMVFSDDCTVRNCVIQNNYESGIYIHNSDNIEISDSFIRFNEKGIHILNDCYNHVISNNDISYNLYGIRTKLRQWHLRYFDISSNRLYNNEFGAFIVGDYHSIQGNIFENNDRGIQIAGSRHNIENNVFTNSSTIGLLLYDVSGKCSINSNNFINNQVQASFMKYRFRRNHFRGNYWSDHQGISPKAIYGKIYWDYQPDPWYPPEFTISIPWITFDRFPAKEPNDIGGNI